MLQSREPGAPQAPAKRRRVGRLLAGAVSVGLHGSILLMVLFTLPKAPLQSSPPVEVQIIAEQPAPVPKPPAPTPPAPKPPAPTVASKSRSTKPVAAHAAAARPVAVASRIRRTNATTSELAAADNPDEGDDSEVSASELAGAASAGGGGGGGPCNMAGRIEAALRKDMIVRSAVSSLAGKAVRVWNGDWVRGHGEDGKGLAAVREAMMWEVAFAPAACKTEPVRGLVVMSVDSPEGKVRLALGSGQWRWLDLLASEESSVRR